MNKYTYPMTSNEEIAEVNKICEKCKGLSCCPFDIVGLKKIAIVNDNLINFLYKPCSFKEKEDKEKKHLKNVKSTILSAFRAMSGRCVRARGRLR